MGTLNESQDGLSGSRPHRSGGFRYSQVRRPDCMRGGQSKPRETTRGDPLRWFSDSQAGEARLHGAPAKRQSGGKPKTQGGLPASIQLR